MSVDHLRQLAAYHVWANDRVWACLDTIGDDRFEEDLHYSVGSLRTQVIHVMAVESWWVRFLATGEVRFLDHADYPTRAAIRAERAVTDRATAAYLAALTDADLARMVRPDQWGEAEPAVAVWQALAQVFNHSTDHRAQMLAGLHRLGGETIAQDYLFHIWERQAEPTT